jgi:AcrR family transcriptional regulator
MAAPNDLDPRIERTRKVVLDATTELVAEIGFDNVTIEGVSERCGVARSTIYRHWPGKEELVVDAIKSRLIAPSEIDTGSVRSDVLTFLAGLIAWFESRDGVIMALSLLTAAHRNTTVGNLHSEATRAKRGDLIRIIERAIERGELPSNVDPREAANDLAGPLFYKRIVVHEPLDVEYVESRTDRWLTQIGWIPHVAANSSSSR